MAMNRTLGMEAQKMQDYVQEQIERRERRGVVFSDEIKEDILKHKENRVKLQFAFCTVSFIHGS